MGWARRAARGRHFEHTQLTHRAESILHRANDPMRMMTFSLEVEHRIDDVLERFGSGEAAILGDVSDQQRRYVLILRHEQQTAWRLRGPARCCQVRLKLQ
jgi:hypothetical protein